MQQVIVYRNPGEAAVWNWIMNGSGGYVIIWIMCAVIAFFICSIFDAKLSRLINRWPYSAYWLLIPFILFTSFIFKIVLFLLTYL